MAAIMLTNSIVSAGKMATTASLKMLHNCPSAMFLFSNVKDRYTSTNTSLDFSVKVPATGVPRKRDSLDNEA